MTRSIRLVLAAALLAPALAFAAPTWWFQDPNYPGDYYEGTFRALSGQPTYAWYDDDVPWSTGSAVRLPEDANYLGDVLTCVACYGGGSTYMHSPYFVGADGKTFFFNHLETIYLNGTGWYNGGAVVGLTGGNTCATGYGTFCGSSQVVSTGPHFCIETASTHPDVDFPPNYTPTSSCAHSNGTSGMGNVLGCSGSGIPASCAQFACGSTLYWNCESDGNLHSCDGSGNPTTQSCAQYGGCHVTGTCTNDSCNTQCANVTYQGKYYWTCESDGNIHSCDSNGNPTTQSCGGAGCVTNPLGTNDVCKNQCSPYSYNGKYYWNCQSDGNLHSCDANNNLITQSCNGAGCTVEPIGTNDICNPSTTCKQYACGATYFWTCGTDGDLHSCDPTGAPIVTSCNGTGCWHAAGGCIDDQCGPAPDAGADGGADAGEVADAGGGNPGELGDAGGGIDGGRSGGPDGGEPTGSDGGDLGPAGRGCGCTTGVDGAFGLAILALGAATRRKRR